MDGWTDSNGSAFRNLQKSDSLALFVVVFFPSFFACACSISQARLKLIYFNFSPARSVAGERAAE
jgi:hypothetical protein